MEQKKQPLAYLLAPTSLENYVGQKNLMGEDAPLRRMIESDRLNSFLLYGPPGTGKTSLAKLVAKLTQANFYVLNAVMAGVADIKQLVEEMRDSLLTAGKRNILFIDEIHRFNKLQQDALLPYVEDGTFVLIGATTENPFYSLNKALLSRMNIFKLESLKKEDLDQILTRALAYLNQGKEQEEHIHFEADAYAMLLQKAGGDARFALNVLELLSERVAQQVFRKEKKKIDKEEVALCLQEKLKIFDKKGDMHYDVVSALIKSMRGSDPDAAIFYLALALQSGEDPVFLARRISICAAEDVGLANPQVLTVCQSAYHIVKEIGMPEARIPLAEAVLLIATSPKSNSAYLAINQAMEFVENQAEFTLPLHLKSSSHAGVREAFGHGKDYLYPHDYPHAYVKQSYLPKEAQGVKFYIPKDNAQEKKMEQYLEFLKKEEKNIRS